MKQVPLPGTLLTLPAIGQGTWSLGQRRADRAREVEALRLGISLGMTLIDTAEYYAAGRAEEVVGEALADCRDQVFLVSKVWPSHAGYAAALDAVRASLRRLRTERLDAVLLHWPTASVPLGETLRAFAELQAAGVVGSFGLSNFDLRWLRAAERALPPGARAAFNQVPYSLRQRGIENAILPHARANKQVVLAWSPLGHGRLGSWPGHDALAAVARARGATPAQIALAFLIARPGVVALPKAVTPEHVRANAAAGDIELSEVELRGLDAAFPRGARAGLRLIPPRSTVFRLIFWIERRRRAGA